MTAGAAHSKAQSQSFASRILSFLEASDLPQPQHLLDALAPTSVRSLRAMARQVVTSASSRPSTYDLWGFRKPIRGSGGNASYLLANRVQWLILQGLLDVDVGFANIYAPNDSLSRCLLWEALAQNLPQTCRWILLGDFNMVERRADKTCQSAALVPMRKRIIFNGMKGALKVDEPPLSAHSLPFSCDNQRPQAAHSLARLNRLYMFEAYPGVADRILLEYSIRGDIV
ncbi:hypothetical protein AXG93_773s1760 [Marchantia polymorpha subsp. ruderalis]|uniref:Endonuclease/exonuclease/phosphatase domain-containing protein n=1 Tax=Marchantia polymorpha subsp. ruderalis TaxID=1480154 RepID=A0A176WCH4_MARPO|nr:hypothetical protein AXG93_773s1760 [Marchantia polymorpha subsp. ruderalis]